MRKVWTLALNDLRLTWRDRASFFWLLALPIGLMAFFGMFGGGGSSKARLTVVDEDGGWLARAFVQQIAGEQIEVVAPKPGEKKVRTLVIPKGFTENVLAGKQQTLAVEKEKDADTGFSMAAEAAVLRATVSTLAHLVEMKQAGTLPQGGAAFAALSAREPLVKLAVRQAGHGQAVPRGRQQSVPGILTMTVLMMTVIYGGVFLTLEKSEGTLRRQLAGPLGRSHVLAGKVLGRVAIAAVQIVLLLVVGRFLFGVSFGHSPAGLALLLLGYAFCVAGLATFLGAVLKNPEQASALGWITAMVMAALGGCWWPSEVVPRWLWKASHVFPTAWAMDAFHSLISFGRGIEAVWLPALVLFGFGALFSLLGVRFLRAALA
ncbi:MAG TPA: ABC transporter permease [Candidatus Polarisedimenticolaceae bacterium]|nr:ABC transporter permease [Candidatus Polarisedimenticolaceae bacterium]